MAIKQVGGLNAEERKKSDVSLTAGAAISSLAFCSIFVYAAAVGKLPWVAAIVMCAAVLALGAFFVHACTGD